MNVPAGKAAILRCAGRLFAEHGYRGTTLRMIADAAGCDVALIPHHFGNKQGLFTAAVLPEEHRTRLTEIFASSPADHLAQDITWFLFDLWERPEGAAALGSLRAVIEDNTADAMAIVGDVWSDLGLRLMKEGVDRPQLRTELVLGTIFSAATMRKFIADTAASQLTLDQAVAVYAPAIHRLLFDRLLPQDAQGDAGT